MSLKNAEFLDVFYTVEHLEFHAHTRAKADQRRLCIHLT